MRRRKQLAWAWLCSRRNPSCSSLNMAYLRHRCHRPALPPTWCIRRSCSNPSIMFLVRKCMVALAVSLLRRCRLLRWWALIRSSSLIRVRSSRSKYATWSGAPTRWPISKDLRKMWTGKREEILVFDRFSVLHTYFSAYHTKSYIAPWANCYFN